MSNVARKPKSRGNGEGSIFPIRRDGVTVAWLARHRPVTGRERSFRRPTREEAAAALTTYLAGLEAGRPEISSRMTVGSWLTRWRDSLTGPDGTVAQYTYNVDRFLIPELGHHKLRELRRIHVEEALAAIARYPKLRGSGPMSAATVAGARRTLSTALEAARQDEPPLIAHNPAQGRLRNAPRPQAEKLYPRPEEAERILEELRGEELYPVFLLMRWTGARVGEVRGLRPRDIDPRRSAVTYAKQAADAALKTPGSRRTMPVPEHVLEELERFPMRSLAHRFTTRTGAPLTNRRLGRVLEAACVRAGVPHYTPHAFRHAFAAELLGSRLPDSYVMTLLGHTSIATTIHEYGHLRAVRGATHTELSEWWTPAQAGGLEVLAR
jgi:integrase